jgi:hypothetical protein
MIIERTRLLLIGLGALTLVLLLEWVWPSGGGAGPVAGLHLPRGAPKASLQARAVAEWADTVLARPLFSISRRPPRVETSAGSTAAPDQARLSGILIGRFGKSAIFAPDGGGKPLVLGEGAAINESTIRSILPNQVILASGAVLKPSFDKNRVPSTPFVPPPFQPGMPNFVPPAFPNGQMPGPGFGGQRSVMPQPEAGSTENPQPDDVPPPNLPPPNVPPQNVPVPGMQTPVPVFRGPIHPQRRD